MKFGFIVAIFSNLVANDYKSHVVVNGVVTFWLISTSVGALQCPRFEETITWETLWNKSKCGDSEVGITEVWCTCDIIENNSLST